METKEKPKYIALNFVGTFIKVSNLERSVEEIKKEIDEASHSRKDACRKLNLLPEETDVIIIA